MTIKSNLTPTNIDQFLIKLGKELFELSKQSNSGKLKVAENTTGGGEVKRKTYRR